MNSRRATHLVATCAIVGMLSAAPGCTVERTLTLYPDNDAAHALGALQATIVGHGNLHGTITMPLPNGQLLQGRYSIAAGGGVEVGSLYASIYGTGGSASASGVSTSTSVSRAGFGEADMMSSQGTTAHCEFVNDNFHGHGHGACRLSNGAVYRMQY
jgi:hypothetical protein